MKKIAVLGSGILLVLCWYGWLVPTAWHADDAKIFSPAHRNASHLGAIFLGMIPPGILTFICAIIRWLK